MVRIISLIFMLLFYPVSFSHAMGDFDEEKPAPPSSQQVLKKAEVDKGAFKAGIKGNLPFLRSFLNLEKSSLFDSNFTTFPAMFAAVELIPLLDLGNIDPKMAQEAYWFARYNIETLALQSGMGIHLNYSQLMGKEPIEKRMNNILKKTGAASLPQGVYPIFLEFTAGAPFYIAEPRMDDLGTLRWESSTFRYELMPESIGLAIAAKSMLSQRLFISNKGNLLGNTPEDGLIGSLLTLSAISEIDALINLFAYNGEKLAKMNIKEVYNPETELKYFPRRINVKLAKEDVPPKPLDYSVQDGGSSLFGQAALIFGVSEFYRYSDPNVKDIWDSLFGEGADALFPLESHRAARYLLDVLFKNIVLLHFDKENNTFVSDYDKGRHGQMIFTDDFCMTIIALSNLYRVLPQESKLKGDVKKYIVLQADFAKDKLQRNDGAFEAAYDISKAKILHTRGGLPLGNQVSGMRGLIEAYKVTRDKKYLDAARKTFEVIEKRLWDKDKGVYLSSEGARANIYIPFTMAGFFRSLAELNAEGVKEAEKGILFANTMMKILQLSETSPTGEVFFTEEEIDKMIDIEGDKIFEMTDPERSKAVEDILRSVVDTDKDDVVKPSYAGGRFGGAPVFINQGSIWK